MPATAPCHLKEIDVAMGYENVVIAWYDATAQEREYAEERLAARLPGATVRWHGEPLTAQTAGAESDRVTHLSMFIHSRVDAATLERFPALRGVATRSTGFDHIDLAACAARDIQVSTVPRYGENTVAEHTFALILDLSRNVHKAYARTAAGDFSLEGLIGFDLKGRTLGVIGVGSIGLHVIRIARAFGMRVLAYDLRPNPLMAEVLDFTYASLEDTLAQADIVTLHAPSIPSTYHLINRDRLRLMKRGALLINTARGSLVDTDALLQALNEGILAGAGLDVLEGEELITEDQALLARSEQHATEDQLRTVLRANVLQRRPDVVITPHIAFYSQEALHRIMDTTVDNLGAMADGAPQNTVKA
jgi:D-lactate dehydrogenase